MNFRRSISGPRPKVHKPVIPSRQLEEYSGFDTGLGQAVALGGRLDLTNFEGNQPKFRPSLELSSMSALGQKLK
jgi:hypothetical protein